MGWRLDRGLSGNVTPAIVAPPGLGGTDGPLSEPAAPHLQGRDSRRGASWPAGRPSLLLFDFRAEPSGASRLLKLHPKPLSLQAAIPAPHCLEAQADSSGFLLISCPPLLPLHLTLESDRALNSESKDSEPLASARLLPGPQEETVAQPGRRDPLGTTAGEKQPLSTPLMCQVHTQVVTRSIQGFLSRSKDEGAERGSGTRRDQCKVVP